MTTTGGKPDAGRSSGWDKAAAEICTLPGSVGVGLTYRRRNEVRNIGAERQRDAQRLVRVPGVELGQPAAHVVGRDAHDRIRAGVVVAAPVKDLHPEQPFLQAAGISGQRALHQMLQQFGGASAGGELVTRKNNIEMLANLSHFGRRTPCLCRSPPRRADNPWSAWSQLAPSIATGTV